MKGTILQGVPYQHTHVFSSSRKKDIEISFVTPLPDAFSHKGGSIMSYEYEYLS